MDKILLGWPIRAVIISTGFFIVTIGCGGQKGPERASVHGTVTVDGQPVEQGTISFAPTDGNEGPSAGGNIENGQYDIPIKLGPVLGMHLVAITGTQETGQTRPAPTNPSIQIPIMRLTVPPQYNTNSQLKREILAGENELSFELEGF